jgi:hypothetical protein
MPPDAWEENSALEIGTLCLHLSHPVAASARTTNRSMTPDRYLTLACQRPMTEAVRVRIGDPALPRARPKRPPASLKPRIGGWSLTWINAAGA